MVAPPAAAWGCCCSGLSSALGSFLPRQHVVQKKPLQLKFDADSEDFGRRRSRSYVLRHAETSSRWGEDGSKSPAMLRVIRDQRLSDRYHLKSEVVGDGINGQVKVVVHKRTKKRRVLKSLAYAQAASDEHWDVLLNEVEVYLRLDHPNICRLLEVFVDEEHCHLVMELCEGRELFERWDGRGTYNEGDAAGAVSMMLDAISYLHAHNVCHRDLKLENWVYADESEGARLKLIDFGFSKIISDDTVMTDTLGTVFYMAPEVIDGSYDNKCDLWSMGVITYMLLTGNPPLGEYDDTDHDIMQEVKLGRIKRYTREWMNISPDGQDFINSLLQRDPARRPTARQAARHPWLTKRRELQDMRINKEVLENMRAFASTNVMKRAACCLIAFSMSVDETDHLEAQFKRLDKEGNGTILVHELVEALKENLDMSEEKSRELFSKLDLTGDKQLNYSEFLAAACQRRFLAQEGLIQDAFKRFDVDNTGVISLDNLREVLGDEYAGVRVEEILEQVDVKQNGVIEYDEFVKALMDLGDLGSSDASPESKKDKLGWIKRISRAFEFTSLGSAKAGPTREVRRMKINNRRTSRSAKKLPDDEDIDPIQWHSEDNMHDEKEDIFTRTHSL